MNNMIIKLKMILAAFLMLGVLTVSAQDGQLLIENLRSELQRTDEIIERAREMVHASNAPAVALALEQSIGIQRQAWENFRANTLDGYKIAARLTMQARELAKKALAGSRLSEQGENAVLNRLERTEELLRRAREEMPVNVDESLSSIFESARRNLAQAWEFYRNGQYRPAIKLSNQVEKTAKRLLQMANRQQNSESNFQRRLEAARQFIYRVEEEAANCQSKPAERLIENAKVALSHAVEMSANGHSVQAGRKLQQARKLASEAADLCGRAKGFSGNLERLIHEAENLKEQIRPGDQNGQRLLDQIFAQLENARTFIAKGDSEGASAALRAAQLTIRQLHRYLNTGEL